ncbi:portal protein [Methylobacterium brachythecii]|uniref:Portal protein n=1 Tax=Methylobacterium brachythecii TaxID=1176177 RepID=A0A7W6F952_9HYPH|nr:portal protein [Methylobacterium brachythecii]MBB3905119.1 hypothetical protein [Methylobacterium brachythecii]GLS44373.1 hypothetical protein GCM10007884_23610 [Methylobacterium brachythecii]
MAQTRKKRAASPETAAEPARAADEKPDANAKVHELAMKRWRRADEGDRENRELAYEDLEFVEVPGAQWDPKAKAIREDDGRPCLEFDRLGTAILQVTGDIRQMRPAIKVVPVDSRGDPDTADVIAGMVRYVENRSDAPAAYFAAADQQVAAGIGHWKVITEYGSDSTFEQEIRIVPVPDGIGVRWDPDAVLPTREDGKFCFVPVDMSRDVYEETYPDHPAAEIGDERLSATGMGGWATADMVRVAEYFTKTPVQKTLALMPDGEILDLTDEGDEEHPEKLARVVAVQREGGRVRVEKRPGVKVERFVVSATAVLEGPDEIPGRFIPVVPAIGIEITIGKKRVRRGLVRKAKDGQRAYNYSRSTEVETEALQPKAGFVGTEAQFKGYEHIWETANSANHPFLPYNPDPKAPGAPQRAQPPVPNAASAQCARQAAEDIKATTGVYDASLGARSNETSGKAIKARQQEGDVGSFVYIVNFSRSIRHTGAIVTGMIPHVYDTARTLRIVGEDGKVDLVDINKVGGLADEDQPLDKIQNDVTVGAYDVAMEMGPSYTTRREAALDGMIALVQAAPQLAPLILDLLAKAQDWPMADKIAKRIRTMLPPQIQAEEAQESGEPMPAPPPPSPEQQAQMAAQQRQQQLAEAQHQLEGQKLQVEQQKIQAEMAKIQGEIQRAALDHQARMAEANRPADPAGAPAGGDDPRIDAIANGLQDLAHVVSMIMETLGGGDGAPAADGPPDPQAGPPGPIDMPPGAMPGPTSEAPPGAFSFDPSAMGQPAAPMMGAP